MEFAIVLPVLIMFVLGTLELARFTVINQKVDKAVNSMADFVTQSSNISEANLVSFTQTIPEIMRPFAFNDTVIFSSVKTVDGVTQICAIGEDTPAPSGDAFTNCIGWQRRTQGTDSSRIGAQNSIAILPGGYTLLRGQDVVVAEIYYDYTPMLLNITNFVPAFSSRKVYKIALYKPRQGMLTTLQP